MAVNKRLYLTTDTLIDVDLPVSEEELNERRDDYHKMSPVAFASKRNPTIFDPVSFSFKGKKYEIQHNYCRDPLCKNFGKSQETTLLPAKFKRYGFTGSANVKALKCKDNPNEDIPTLGCFNSVISNWSIVDELHRLVRVNSLFPKEEEYEFHKPTCSLTTTPFDTPKDFYKRGKSVSKSQKYQCKTCKKYTNVEPPKSRNSGYYQQRNEVLVNFAKQIVNKTPINRACEILDIGRGTYYQKLEILHQRCLEFLDTRETKAFAKKEFNEIWLNTDKLHYNLNNVLKRGRGRNSSKYTTDKQLPTMIVATADAHSLYCFRTDIAYDWDASIDQIEEDTKQYFEDHLNHYQRKNGRFEPYGAFPMHPAKNDTQTRAEYLEEIERFENRMIYVDGLHVNAAYTTRAHLWLIKNMIRSKKWRFISDDDASIHNAYRNIFKDEILSKDAHQIVCKTDKTLTRPQAKNQHYESYRKVREWAKGKGFGDQKMRHIAEYYLQDELLSHRFHIQNPIHTGESYLTHANNPIMHPLATRDAGYKSIDILTDVSHLSNIQLASLIFNTSDFAINNYFQAIRRRISTIERPILTSRGDGVSYIYANFYPKYAHMALTILRTYYNFCLESGKGLEKQTPAQKIGIADRAYDWYDIFYKR